MARTSNYQAHRAAVIDLVAQTYRRHSRPPTIRDLAAELDVGVATVHSYLCRLAEEGLVEWTPNKHRSLRLTHQGHQLASSLETPSA